MESQNEWMFVAITPLPPPAYTHRLRHPPRPPRRQRPRPLRFLHLLRPPRQFIRSRLVHLFRPRPLRFFSPP